MTLTPTQLAHYQEHGYVVPDWRLPESQLSRMRAAADIMLAANPQYADLHPTLLEEGEPWIGFGSYEPMLAHVRQLIGDDIILWSAGYFGKPADNGKATPWHQDGGYWPIEPLATCTAWVALDDATTTNGCLSVVAGSHRARKLYDHRRNDAADLTLNQELDDEALAGAEVHAIELEAGQVSFHDVYLVHGSAPNKSANRRRGITFRYMPTTSHFNRETAANLHRTIGVVNHEFRTLHLVSGGDACGRNELTRSPPAG